MKKNKGPMNEVPTVKEQNLTSIFVGVGAALSMKKRHCADTSLGLASTSVH